MTELEQVAILEDLAIDAPSIEEGPVPRVGVLDEPSTHHAAERRVISGHPIIRNAE